MLVHATPSTANTACSAESGALRVPVLELYTSEGCDSCPPTDRWVSGLPQRGYNTARVVSLAFHVDYWNYLGWQDPFSKAQFSTRQRLANSRNQSRVVYTPQLLLDGGDYRMGLWRDDFGTRLTELNSQRPRANIRMHITGGQEIQGQVTVPDVTDRKTARIYLAVYENGLATNVPAGENRGKRLSHDFVVRELYGPWVPDADGTVRIGQTLHFPAHWQVNNLHVAAFAQNHATGATLQALSLPYCPAAHATFRRQR